MDMLVNKPLAKALVDKVARFAFELNKSVLEKIGNEIDSFCPKSNEFLKELY